MIQTNEIIFKNLLEILEQKTAELKTMPANLPQIVQEVRDISEYLYEVSSNYLSGSALKAHAKKIFAEIKPDLMELLYQDSDHELRIISQHYTNILR